MNKNVLFTLLFFCVTLHSRAYGASFDCEKASQEVEQRICQDQALSFADESLAWSYRRYLAIIPESDRASVRKEQIAWLKKRNLCTNHAKAVACIKNAISERIEELDTLREEKRMAFERDVVALIPNQPQKAAQHLKNYSYGLAYAWLAYLYESTPDSGVSAQEADVYYQRAKNSIEDPFPKSILDSIEADESKKYQVYSLLRILLEQEQMRDFEKSKHCFIFAKNDIDVYHAFGPLYGSSRDSFSPVCSPYTDDLFELPEWKALNDLMDPAVFDVYSTLGTIRASYSLGWRIDQLKANVQPELYLLDKTKTDWESDYNYPHLWQPRQLEQALHQAEAVTTQWLQEKRGIEAHKASQIAKRIVTTWLNSRLGLIDDIMGLKELDGLYKNHKTASEVSP